MLVRSQRDEGVRQIKGLFPQRIARQPWRTAAATRGHSGRRSPGGGNIILRLIDVNGRDRELLSSQPSGGGLPPAVGYGASVFRHAALSWIAGRRKACRLTHPRVGALQ